MTRSANTKRLLATIGIIGAAGAVAAGTYSQFTGTTSVTQTIDAGTLVLNSATNTLTIAATDIAPGDTIQRGVNVKNTGSVAAKDITLTTTLASGAPSNALTTDATNGLQMTVEQCTALPALQLDGSYDCAGASTVVASGTILRAATSLGLASVGANNFFRVTVSFPSIADNSFQGLSTAVDYTFDAVQRDGTFR